MGCQRATLDEPATVALFRVVKKQTPLAAKIPDEPVTQRGLSSWWKNHVETEAVVSEAGDHYVLTTVLEFPGHGETPVRVFLAWLVPRQLNEEGANCAYVFAFAAPGASHCPEACRKLVEDVDFLHALCQRHTDREHV